ncbi:hypothetical protein A6R68_11926 [Neotoma lepida]|uniref:Beta-retroviral matrix protein domain-containing protein n=1 Tax=Neotoma lepida TaxID=56216 RepID=A0A1A6FTP0_NEOLE|nr:hypothetical protein A6R68_11926 [Neotoma lepida]
MTDSLQVLLKSKALNLSDSQALQTRTYLIKIATWLPDGSLFDWDTWDRIETLIHRAQVDRGEIPPLGAIPIVTALKDCFPPRLLRKKKPMATLEGDKEKGKETREKKDVQVQPAPGPKLPSQSDPASSLYPPLDPFDSTPWPPDPPTNPFHIPSAPLPYHVKGTPREK